MHSVLNRHNVAKHTEFTWDSYGSMQSMQLPLVMRSVSKRALQWYSKRYCVAIAQGAERWIFCMSLSVLVSVTLVITFFLVETPLYLHRPRSIPQKHYSSASGTHFC
jgi:hypothetical protein